MCSQAESRENARAIVQAVYNDDSETLRTCLKSDLLQEGIPFGMFIPELQKLRGYERVLILHH